MTGVITEFPVPSTDSWPVGITAGGGSIWFAESLGNQIGHLNLASVSASTSPVSRIYHMAAGAPPIPNDTDFLKRASMVRCETPWYYGFQVLGIRVGLRLRLTL